MCGRRWSSLEFLNFLHYIFFGVTQHFHKFMYVAQLIIITSGAARSESQAGFPLIAISKRNTVKKKLPSPIYYSAAISTRAVASKILQKFIWPVYLNF